MLLKIMEGARLDRLLSCGCDGGCDPTHEIIDKKIKLHLIKSYPDRFRDNRYVWGSEKTEKEEEKEEKGKEEVKNA
ncbi:MAG: hypothetical protein SVE93_08000 [Candidatus Thermoplasmatota archaeon]|nr:hypothetical protein [Candidatus Thermoplasmatota archaeon]